MFRDLYELVERATKVPQAEFLENPVLREEVRRAIEGMLRLVEEEAKPLVGEGDVLWNLVKSGVISAPLSQEILDIMEIVKSGDDSLLYASLVRIMEDLEEAYHAVRSRKVVGSRNSSLSPVKP